MKTIDWGAVPTYFEANDVLRDVTRRCLIHAPLTRRRKKAQKRQGTHGHLSPINRVERAKELGEELVELIAFIHDEGILLHQCIDFGILSLQRRGKNK